MTWVLDPKFDIPGNEAVVACIRRTHPFAHDEVATALTDSAKGLKGVSWYCPDGRAYAVMLLHTDRKRIFGIAFGMHGLAYRMPTASRDESLRDGGKPCHDIGPDWIRFDPWRPDEARDVTAARLRRWCRVAREAAG
jgi:hypothetical protein